MKTSNENELIYWPKNKTICGIDEAGRGPIAGPLVVCGVILPIDYQSDEIYDSKKLTLKKREELFKVIIKDAIKYSIKIITPKVIDKYNIYRATQNAMQEIALELNSDIVLTDAMPLNINDKTVIAIIKGDQKSINIAAASILAKVIRDHIMLGYDVLYPQYGFKSHKGYPTKAHIEAMHQYGVLDIYRQSYRPVSEMAQITLDI